MRFERHRLSRWRVAFLVGIAIPVVAAVIKPVDYSFYMFFPADPTTALDRGRLVTANILLIAGFILSLVAAIRLVLLGLAQKQRLLLLLPLVVLLHPLFQPVFLEGLDTNLNYRWRDRVTAFSIIGRTEADVRAFLGAPSRVIVSATYTLWEYQPIPFYWIGSSGQVFFVNGVVNSFDANDD